MIEFIVREALVLAIIAAFAIGMWAYVGNTTFARFIVVVSTIMLFVVHVVALVEKGS